MYMVLSYIYTVIIERETHLYADTHCIRGKKMLRLTLSHYNMLTVSHSYILGGTYTDFFSI